LIANPTGTVGLHYTGGTKAMAVHAYRAVERALAGKSPAPVFSYLDATTFELRIDPAVHEKVLFDVKPTIRDLVALHGNPLKADRPSRDTILLPAATALAQASPNGLSVWRNWCDKVLRSEDIYTGKDWRGNSRFKEVALSWPMAPELGEVVKILNSELNLPHTAKELSFSAIQLPNGVKEYKQLCKWLDGEWLEQYVLSQVAAVAESCHLHDYGMTLETDEKQDADFRFEFDVAAMRGYQLFGISCTTSSSKSLVKSKLFEASIRARQLGGDEARVGLVCGYADAVSLEREISQSWDAEGKIRVFGPADLPDLAEKLKDWFETAQ